MEGELYMNMKAEIGVMRLQMKDHQRSLENHQKPGEGPRTQSPSPPSEGTNKADILILAFWSPEL